MKVNALVMAGGRGERLKVEEEKPLLKLKGKPLIQYVVEALKKVVAVDRIVVVTSKYTPKTASMVQSLQVEVLEAPGKGYIADLCYAVKKLGLKGPIMVVSADLPLISHEVLNMVIEYFKQRGKPALSVMVSRQVFERLGLTPSLTLNVNGNLLVPAGINIVSDEIIGGGGIEEEKMVLDVEEVAVNVNTVEDLNVAEKLLSLKSSKLKS
ncbi:MAG: NTP transferase domain-containing protein [Candidatus Bathyarchaeota archaeon]|nr:NTP transferase domain-containing protein [Candidatus Bathyarchaeota archaeon]